MLLPTIALEIGASGLRRVDRRLSLQTSMSSMPIVIVPERDQLQGGSGISWPRSFIYIELSETGSFGWNPSTEREWLRKNDTGKPNRGFRRIVLADVAPVR